VKLARGLVVIRATTPHRDHWSHVSAISIDRAEFPFIRIRFDAAPTNDEFADYLGAYQQLLDAERPYGALIVTRADLPMTRSQHARWQADFMARNRDLMARYVVGVGFVLPSLVTRGVLRAILKWQPMPCPHQVFQHEPEGATWVRTRLEQAKLAGSQRFVSTRRLA